MNLWRRFLCLIYYRHDPVRQPHGGFRCRRCGLAASSMEQLGFEHGGYIPKLRRVYGRDSGLSRTSEWTPTRRGW